MMKRVFNFNPGPATLPEEVLREAEGEFLDYQGSGMSIIEMSHRAKPYETLHHEAAAGILQLLGLGDDYSVLFLQGGATLQFAMLPMNFLADGMIADYAVTGDFAGKALRDAKRVGAARAAVDVSGEGFCRVPQPEELTHSERQAYLHITTNNTIFGTAWREYPDFGERRLVADMSSDFLSHPFEAGRFSLLYAGAQKNLGPAGAAVVVVKKDFLATAKDGLPEYLSYKAQAKSDSMLNTPPVFTVYMIGKVVKWLMARGGLAAMGELNRAKSDLVYAAIDAHPDFYRGHAEKGSRSLMNVTFRLPTEALEKAFVEEAKENMLVGVKGHRSVGGMRASLYNYMPLEGAERLAAFMEKFYQANR